MVVYQGGKSRIGKRIYRVILMLEEAIYLKTGKTAYFEPFVGMAGVLTHFGKDNNRVLYACDLNKDIILMWKAFQRGWKPKLECSLEKYERLKNSNVNSAERGFIGTVASWGGIFFHAYRLGYISNRDYLQEGYNSIQKILPSIKYVNFLDACSYEKFDPIGCIIYADPPYIGNTLGNPDTFFQSFDHEKFWEKMREWSENNLVIISEWKAPKDFIKIWSTKVKMSSGKGRKSTNFSDNLYIHKSIYNLVNLSVLKNIKKI